VLTGEPVDQINDEAYPELYYKGNKEDKDEYENDITIPQINY